MGIVHFMSVGTSPGAVTSALSYLAHNRHNLKPHYDPEKNGTLMQSLVVFCSHEVDAGAVDNEAYVDNAYASTHRQSSWKPPQKWPNVIEVIQDFIVDEDLLPPKGLLYVVPVAVNEYAACFETIAKITLALAEPDKTGQWLWANLTGGTNVLNAALMQVASLSGLIGNMYYTFVPHEPHRRCLRPCSMDTSLYQWVWLPLIKTTFDQGYYQVLEILEDGEWRAADEILSRLKAQGFYRDMEVQFFAQQYLNRMSGDVLAERDKDKRTRADRISPRGREVLEALYADELLEALIRRDRVDADLIQCYREALAQYRR